ncbi:MAG: hypothetical protein IT443_03245 [Phycisphaeraceae bacterium]|nr:hypothetical protein [Phycisphaeraceae bacterium]
MDGEQWEIVRQTIDISLNGMAGVFIFMGLFTGVIVVLLKVFPHREG